LLFYLHSADSKGHLHTCKFERALLRLSLNGPTKSSYPTRKKHFDKTHAHVRAWKK
jgi:hypothetical protein